MTVIITDNPALINFLDKLVTHDYTAESFDEYYCINIQPFKCNGCAKYICYVEAGPHMIVIWKEKDDDRLLEVAEVLKRDGSYDPHVVSYNRILGPCITWEDAEELGWIESIQH